MSKKVTFVSMIIAVSIILTISLLGDAFKYSYQPSNLFSQTRV